MNLNVEDQMLYRVGNENLVRVTPNAARKIDELQQRENQGNFFVFALLEGVVMDFLTK